jgi:hypothetical protein
LNLSFLDVYKMKNNYLVIRSIAASIVGVSTIFSSSFCFAVQRQEDNAINGNLISDLTPPAFQTGSYICDDGGSYYVRRVGNRVWWYGESGDGSTWSNVFKGIVVGNRVRGEWADIPKTSARGSGTMVLERINSREFRAVSKTGGFSGGKWTMAQG